MINRKLLITGTFSIAVAIILMIVGWNIVLTWIGSAFGGHDRGFYQAYPWLSSSNSPQMFWTGLAIMLAGACTLALGAVGIGLALVLKRIDKGKNAS